MTNVIALFGKSGVGKTQVADALGRQLSIQVRHCGEIVKQRALQLGLDLSQFSEAEHNIINEATRKSAEHPNGNLIIEGRFLDEVLKGIPTVLLIRLTCCEQERLRRLESASHAKTQRPLKPVDNMDSGETLHVKSPSSHGEYITINTDGLSIIEVSKVVLEHYSKMV